MSTPTTPDPAPEASPASFWVAGARAASVESELSGPLLVKFRTGGVSKAPEHEDDVPMDDFWVCVKSSVPSSPAEAEHSPTSPAYSPTSPAYSPNDANPTLMFLNGPPAFPLWEVVSDIHGPTLFPKYIDLRTALRLALLNKAFRNELMPIIEGWVIANLAKVGWKQVKAAAMPSVRLSTCWCPDPESKWRTKWITATEVRSKAPSMRVAHAGKVYEPVVADAGKAWNQLRSKLCRECYTPTASVCQTSGGGSVLVCGKCQKAGSGVNYSSLVKISDARTLVASKSQKKPLWLAERKADAELRACFHSPRVGYLWHHEVVQAAQRLIEKEQTSKEMRKRLSELHKEVHTCMRRGVATATQKLSHKQISVLMEKDF